jgi:integration host factor subunit beta
MPLIPNCFSATFSSVTGENRTDSVRERFAMEAKAVIRSELVKKLEAENPGMTGEEIERIVDLFFSQISQRLADGGRVEIRGFGAFSTRGRNPRKGRNPRTGSAVDVPAKRVPYFKPGKEIRERLNK